MAHEFRYVQSGDQRIRVAVEGSGPLVLMVHGFPESWYSWRHQLGPVAAAGFTAAAIDVRGYGGSSKPYPVEAYDMASIVADNQAVADALGGERRSWSATTGAHPSSGIQPGPIRSASRPCAACRSRTWGMALRP